jgi:peroxiredoxin
MAHVLDELVVFDPDGRSIRLGSLWTSRTTVLVFVRHFGCVFCRQQVGELLAFLDRIRAAGAELVIIGNGSIEDARAFRDERRLTVPLFTDPACESYCALDMRSGVATVMRPSVFLRSLKALARGYRQATVAGSPLQQGGVVVIDPGGAERYRYVSQTAGDHPLPSAILRALKAAA